MKKQLLKSALIVTAGLFLSCGNSMAMTINMADNDIATADFNASSSTGFMNIASATVGVWNVSAIISTSTATTPDSDPAYFTIQSLQTDSTNGTATSSLTITASEDFAAGSSLIGYNDYLTAFFSSQNQNGIVATFQTTIKDLTTNISYTSTIFSTNKYTFSYEEDIITSFITGAYNITSIVTLTGKGQNQYNVSTTSSPVPEPATMLLFGTGVAGLAGFVRRKK